MVNSAATRLRLRSVVIAAGAAFALFLLIASPVHVKAAGSFETIPLDGLRSAINSEDPSSAAMLFAEDAVVIQPRLGGLPQTYVGREQIRFWLRALASQHARLAPRTAVVNDGNRAR